MVVDATGVEAVVVVVADGGVVDPPDPLEDDVVTGPADADAVAEGALEPPEPEVLLTVTVEDALGALAVTVVVEGDDETLAETGGFGSPLACAGSASAIDPRAAAAIMKTACRTRGGRST